jgi:hypothetical protein
MTRKNVHKTVSPLKTPKASKRVATGEILALQLNTDLGTSGLQVNGNTVSNFGNLLDVR